MASTKTTVRITANFEANLSQIAAFWSELGAAAAYASLLNELAGTVITRLEEHPRIGRNFLARIAKSVEVRERMAALLNRLGATEVREYLCGDYLLLYGIVTEGGTRKPGLTIYLLAIKHHRQLSFDFEGFWQTNRGEHG
ncbi:type II toxin-antitoxin system RelE/ParE family toxin [Piscinibacter sp.]|uniref:type II toxin-antitoxin system RelE/ParE family toxin n=1 Tax=Piscinibacter sp. TaxID=1903157 RepID=UPI002C92C109|nr:type II toxin-antitoxin system RelE/ParE family toxin [Albitalea sp.]HUG25839.1 type II toxin-antitoxin system RelE/ParE family toxin [Albitalea sp.]